MAARTFRKKKVVYFSAFFFYVYTNVDYRERARAASKVKMSGSEK